MSNLLKQCYVVSTGMGTRVINSNVRMQEFSESASPETGDSGFSEGIAAEEVELSAEAYARELKEKAAAEADEILSAAKEDADRILTDAKERADAVYEEQKRAGYEEGMEKRKLELDAWEQETRKALGDERRTLRESFDRRQETMEHDIVDAVIQVFDKVFGIQFEKKQEILYHLVKGALMDTDAGDKLRIHMSRADEPVLKEHEPQMQEIVGKDAEIEFVRDNSLEEGQCRLETAYGVIDCSVDTELSALLKDIRSLV